MRPITCGDRDLAVIMGKMINNLRPMFTSYLVPQQLCVGVKGAAEIIINVLRTTVEHWSSKVVLVLDIKNKVYFSVERATVAERLLEVPDIGNYPIQFDGVRHPQQERARGSLKKDMVVSQTPTKVFVRAWLRRPRSTSELAFTTRSSSLTPTSRRRTPMASCGSSLTMASLLPH